MVWLKNGIAWLGHWMPKNNLPLIHPSDKVRFEHKGRRGGCMSEGGDREGGGGGKRDAPGLTWKKKLWLSNFRLWAGNEIKKRKLVLDQSSLGQVCILGERDQKLN